MMETEIGRQQYLEALERSLRIIRSTDRLSLEASIEELCKILLLNYCFEKKNETSLKGFASKLTENNEKADEFYLRFFDSYVPTYTFKGWDKLTASKESLVKVIDVLSEEGLFDGGQMDKAKAFSEFLQLHYAGYLSEYSTPELLNQFIVTALDSERLLTLADPCCGIGGALVEAVRNGNANLRVKGFDVNQRMANTANLQLMLYGAIVPVVECRDVMETAVAFMEGPFDAVAVHLPSRHRAFSIAGRRYDGVDRMFSRIQEDIIVGQILKMLKPNGIAAIVVSDELLMSERRADSRRWLFENAQILNITRFEGISYNGSSNVKAYNVVFLKRLEYVTSDVCMATIIKTDASESYIKDEARKIRNAIYGGDAHMDENNRFFRLMEEDVWNVNLLFAREKMGSYYPTRQLKDLVYHDRERARVKDARNYKQLMVRSKGLGVVERDEEYVGSASTKAVRYVARSSQIIISSLEADKGAIGIVPKELNNALVSRNYYLFSIASSEVDPDYLVMVLSSEPVLRQLKLRKSQYVMSRISIEKILSLVIPLPSLEEQRALVGNLVRKVNRVRQIQNELEKEQTEFACKLFGKDEVTQKS